VQVAGDMPRMALRDAARTTQRTAPAPAESFLPSLQCRRAGLDGI